MVEAIVYALFLFVLALALHATASLTLLAAACLFLSAAAANKRNKPKEKKSLPCSGLTGGPDDKAAFAGFDFDKPETGEDDEPSNFLKPDTLLPAGFLESEEVLPRRNTGREVPPLYEDGEQKRSRARAVLRNAIALIDETEDESRLAAVRRAMASARREGTKRQAK